MHRQGLASTALALALAAGAAGCIGDQELVDDTATADLAAPAGQGTVSLEWSVYVGDEMLSCIDAGADSVELVARSPEEELVQSMPCLDGLAESAGIPGGSYALSVRLVDADGGALDSLELGMMTVAADQTTPLGAIEFVVAGDGARNTRVRRDQRY